ncbi:methyltransferase domain-containing protein [Sphingobacterium phlebotomi]|uniref:Methyltransferase domain-containing protein n=1 Tax=Sphingobacterium phlebotomi TaxID=2605433 RepID=A0A5D4GS59_9SPHI|nr:class I SAM-dependent methyltransferase [Sphingobacterium phlebotomi]TYR31207.1 methyltransferase domain-containing protein [Sphingobacterium phlebotomi]
MNNNILSPEVQAFIRQHAHEDASSIALKKSPFVQVSSSELAQQVNGWQKVSTKVREWLEQGSVLYYPEKLNLEQCSSARTGKFKASLLSPNSTVLDLTGGFGVDSYYFAQQAKKVIHCEINPELSQIVTHNLSELGVDNVQFHTGDGIAFLISSDKEFDYIYADPSRRVKNQKVFRLEDCEPNILAYQPLFFEHSDTLITKLAPLLDISGALNVLPHVKDVYVISIENDCKELLFVQHKSFQGIPRIHAVRLSTEDEPGIFSFNYVQEKEATPVLGEPTNFLYDPDVAITKAGAFKSVATVFNLQKLHQHSHLYTRDHLIPEFPGRVFQIQQVVPFSVFKKNVDITKANIIAKNFPLKVDDIRRKFKIKDGGEDYLYFTTLFDDRHVIIYGKRVV